MPRFDLDAQRALVCVFGMLCLLGEAIAFFALEKALPDTLTYVFAGMVMWPLSSSTVERYRQTKSDRDDPPSPPPEAAGDQEEGDDEEVFRRDHGYYQLRTV